MQANHSNASWIRCWGGFHTLYVHRRHGGSQQRPSPAPGGSSSCAPTPGRPQPSPQQREVHIPTTVFKGGASEVPGDSELLPLFHLQSRLHPQAADRHHMWAMRTQHASGVDPAAGFCLQTGKGGFVKHGSLGPSTTKCRPEPGVRCQRSSRGWGASVALWGHLAAAHFLQQEAEKR